MTNMKQVKKVSLIDTLYSFKEEEWVLLLESRFNSSTPEQRMIYSGEVGYFIDDCKDYHEANWIVDSMTTQYVQCDGIEGVEVVFIIEVVAP